MDVGITDVREFWNANPCQSRLSAEADRRAYFQEIAIKRYEGREWHVPIIARFEMFRGRDVLEIGCGIGTDGFEFARHGAHYVGIDLTPKSIELARERFAVFSVPGTFIIANAEAQLPFGDCRFDHIYSFGVLHHSPHTEAMVDEIHRVLRPGGSFTVMLYNRSSINYHVEIMCLRRLFRLMLYPHMAPRILSNVTGLPEWKLAGHRQRLVGKGRINKADWISMNTDGPYCPLAKVYSRREGSELFEKFRNVQQEVWEFNTDHWPYVGRLVPVWLARAMGRRWGWHRIISGNK